MPMLLITISMISYHLLLSLENLNDEERKWSTCDGESTCLWQHLRWSFWLRTFIGTSLPCLDGLTPVHHVDLDDPELLGDGRQGRRRPPEDEVIVMDVLIFCLVLHGWKSTSSSVMLLVMIAEMMAMSVILMMMTNELHLGNVEKRGRVGTPILSPLRMIAIEIDSITLLGWMVF